MLPSQHLWANKAGSRAACAGRQGVPLGRRVAASTATMPLLQASGTQPGLQPQAVLFTIPDVCEKAQSLP
jgi:hypothetical protein